MQYEITTGKTPEGAKLVINIDQIPFLAVPGVVMIGVGDKGKRYRTYLDKILFSEKNQLLHSLVKMHDMAIENGGMHLQCKCQFSKFHAQVLKDLITENAETFTSLISYLVPDSKNKAIVTKPTEASSEGGESGSEAISGELMPPAMQMGNRMTLDQLNVPGADQLRALIAADMAKEAEVAQTPQPEQPSVDDRPNVVHI